MQGAVASALDAKAQKSPLDGMIMLQSPGRLNIKTPNGITLGGIQSWYPIEWQCRAGCGPTTASLLFWYLAQTRASCEALCSFDATTKEGFIRLMQETWQHVRPGFRGLNKTSMMVDGALSYAKARGVALKCEVLEVPPLLSARPKPDEMRAFLVSAIQNDLPVAFLNLSNGKLKNLDGWHWVTLVGIDPENATALMYDQGAQVIIDLDLWLQTTLIGGGFVMFRC